MKLSVLAVALADRTWEEACRFLSEHGVDTVEIGCGGYPGKAHCDPEILLHQPDQLKTFTDTLKKYGLGIAALSAHGNAVHPDPAVASSFEKDFENAVLLAEKLSVDTVVTFSGCPGGAKGDRTPNWITCAWPPDYLEILKYQWNEVLIPYWTRESKFALDHGVTKIAFEMHPGFCVYNPETMLRIREAVGPVLGANVDPSHLFWQGIDPVYAVRTLGKAVHYVHAKDTALDAYNIAQNGVLDTKDLTRIAERSWVFRTVGYGHDAKMWKDFVSALRKTGYEGPVSIEHEDGLMSGEEGLCKAIAFMKNVMMVDEPGEMYWA